MRMQDMSEQADGRASSSRKSLLNSTRTALFRHMRNLSLTNVDENDGNEDFWGPLGLTLLHEPSEPLIDFIFVHGLGGGSRKTWSKTKSLAHYWPKEWMPSEPEFKNVRIHVFGYNATWKERHASMLTVHDFGQALLSDVRNSPVLGRSDTPIVLVGRSMGGLVIKKMLLLAKEDPNFSDIATRIHTLFFLATPHRGSNLANTLNNFLKLAVGYGSKAYVDNLYPYSEVIQTINDQFREACQGKHLYSFFETIPTALGLIVEKASAVLELPGEQVSHLNANHSQVCKFDTPNDSNYIRLRAAFVANISLIQKTYLSSRIQKRNFDIKRLATYLGLKEQPGVDLRNIGEHQVPGTCAWLTEKETFHQWLDVIETSPRIYWLKGEPGSGKSTLASHVVNYLEACNGDCAYFFFRHSHTGKSTVAELLCSLALQMASDNKIIRQKLLGMCDSGVTIDSNDERSIWKTVFAARIFRTEFQTPQHWVIDGLDECANPASLFPLVAKIDQQIRLQIFITSRPSLSFDRAFHSEDITNISEVIPIDATLSDIRMYINQKSSYLLAESEEERQELVHTILDKSNGNFLWTDLVVKRIQDAVSKEQIHAILTTIPKEMNQLYSEIMSSVMASETASIARAILSWTLCSLRPLSVDELREALRLDIGENLPQLDKTAGSICGNLVYVDSDSRVQATHQTVRDFLFGQSNNDIEHAMKWQTYHTRIAEICLIYLCGNEMKPRRFRRVTSHNSNEVKRSPFSTYAILYFSHHIAHSSSSVEGQMMSLNRFLTNNSTAWIEAIASTKDLTPLTRTANNLETYINRRTKDSSTPGVEEYNVLNWANDLRYLVAQFGQALTASPQAIYHLIPAVCPRNSMIFKAFKSHPRALQVVGLEQDDWDERLCCIALPGMQVFSAACQDNRFALGTSKGTVYIYDESTFLEQQQLPHGEPVRRLCFGSVNEYLVSVGRKQLKYWSVSAGELMWSLATRDEVIAVAFSEDDKQLHIATKANQVLLLDAMTGEEVERFGFADWDGQERKQYGFQRQPTHADFMVGIGLLGVTYLQRPVNFWDIKEHQFVGLYHQSSVESSKELLIQAFKFNPNPEINLAAVSYHDGSTHVFDPEIQETQAKADTGATVLAASPDGMVLATGSGNGFIKLYDFETMKMLHQIFLYERAIRIIIFNSSGQRLFEVRGSSCNIWEPLALMHRIQHSCDDASLDIGDPVRELPRTSVLRAFNEDEAITAIAAHHDSEFVFCGRENGSVAVYATKTGKVAQELCCDFKNVAVDILVWNECRGLLVIVARSGTLLVRNLTRTTPGPFALGEAVIGIASPSVVSQVLISPDGERLLISTAEGDTFWSLKSASVIKKRCYPEPRPSWRWACHPDNESLLLVEGGRFSSYRWELLGDATTQDTISDASDLEIPDMAVTGFFCPGRSRHACLVASPATRGTNASASVRLLPAKMFNSTTRAMAHTPAPLEAIKDLKAIVGMYKTWLVYLQHGGWICSVNIDTASRDRFYLRHFLVPLHWHGVTVAPMLVTLKGSIVLAVGDELAVFHNGLDFEEKVPV